MARKRSRANRNGMIHAAIDQMVVLGFTATQVRRTVRRLLKEYGDMRVGWGFISQDGYLVLIEALCEEQEVVEGLATPVANNDARSSSPAPLAASADEAGRSNLHTRPSCSGRAEIVEWKDIEMDQNSIRGSEPVANDALYVYYTSPPYYIRRSPSGNLPFSPTAPGSP